MSEIILSQFKDIKWYEWKYKISNLWEVKSLCREKQNHWKTVKTREKILTIHNNWNWYL